MNCFNVPYTSFRPQLYLGATQNILNCSLDRCISSTNRDMVDVICGNREGTGRCPGVGGGTGFLVPRGEYSSNWVPFLTSWLVPQRGGSSRSPYSCVGRRVGNICLRHDHSSLRLAGFKIGIHGSSSRRQYSNMPGSTGSLHSFGTGMMCGRGFLVFS